MREKYLKYAFYICGVLSLLSQAIVLYYYRDTPQFSDANDYHVLAGHCYVNHSWYPDKAQIYANYIFNPGYVNYLLLHLKLFGNFSYVGLFNILFTFIIGLEIFILARYFFDRHAAYIASALFLLLPSTILFVQPHLTELPFLACMLGCICLIRKDKPFYLLGAAVLLVMANWIRPVALLFLIPVVIYMLYHKFKLSDLGLLLIPAFALVVIIGINTKNNSGYFLYQATTGGFNLIQGANDDMNGGYEQTCFQPGKIGYIENIDDLTFAERDAIWKSRSINWMLSHPGKYIAYIPVKFARMWWGDDYLDGFLKGSVFYNNEPTLQNKLHRLVSSILFNLIYYFILFCFVAAIFKMIRQYSVTRKHAYELYLLLLPLILGTGMQSLIYGTQRYHHPYMPVLIILAAGWISIHLKKVVKE